MLQLWEDYIEDYLEEIKIDFICKTKPKFKIGETVYFNTHKTRFNVPYFSWHGSYLAYGNRFHKDQIVKTKITKLYYELFHLKEETMYKHEQFFSDILTKKNCYIEDLTKNEIISVLDSKKHKLIPFLCYYTEDERLNYVPEYMLIKDDDKYKDFRQVLGKINKINSQLKQLNEDKLRYTEYIEKGEIFI